MKKILLIQTAFIGDVILATGLIEKLHQHYPEAQIDFLLRKGNEKLLHQHPLLHEVIIWDKKAGKYKQLLKVAKHVRRTRYDLVVNCQRFGASGFITWRSKAKHKVGFDKNPFAFAYTQKHKHVIGDGTHEIARNHQLIQAFTDQEPGKPKLYPTSTDFEAVTKYQNQSYYCIAPTSVWFTKQWPAEKWIQLLNEIGEHTPTYLLGGPTDADACASIQKRAYNKNVHNLAGQLSFLESAALMKGAIRNFVNDSGPMHLASAMNAPVTAIFCSTIPDFGFGPLSDDSKIAETALELDCRPCGLHGHPTCPKGHFKCSEVSVAVNR